MPTVSVIVPNFNYAKYLPDCLQSILNQTYQDFEVILSDDASTDGSLEVAAGFKDSRVKVLQSPLQAPTSAAAARNRGIKASSSPVLAFLDSDDMLTRDSLEKRLSALEGVDVVCGQAVNITAEDTLEKAYALPLMPSEPTLFHMQTILLRRSLLDKHGLFDESFYHREDGELWFRLFGRKLDDTRKAKFRCLDDVVAYYRVHPESKTAVYLGYNDEQKRYWRDKIGKAYRKAWKGYSQV